MAGALETPRLSLVPWDAASDVALLRRLARSPEVVRFIADGAPWPEDRILEAAARVEASWAQHGFGWRRVVLRSSGEAVGFVALQFAGPGVPALRADEHEIGWWLDPAAWGHGYAREGAAAVLAEAFERVRAPSVVARVQPANAASLAICEAIGLVFEEEVLGRYGDPIRVFRRHAAG